MSLRAARGLLAAAALVPAAACAQTLTVVDDERRPLASAMVTQRLARAAPADTSDGGYARPGVEQRSAPQVTRFTDAAGRVVLPARGAPVRLRLRRPGHRDVEVDAAGGAKPITVMLPRETDPLRLAESRPANAWFAALDLGSADDRRQFALQCGFCHQQGSAPTRRPLSAAEWSKAIDRMVRYGSRLPSDLQRSLPAVLEAGWRELREHPTLVPEATPWPDDLALTTVHEWPLGDEMSQLHDVLLARSGLVYLADNIQDRLYEIDPANGRYTVHRIPGRPGDAPGGLLAARLKDFPRHDSRSNAHSLAQSPRDGHIFITPSAQRRLVEFDPATKAFTLHEIGGGFYPHTIRADAQDRIWFTLALSNQIGQFDRRSGRFTLHELPARGLREKLTTWAIGGLFRLMGWGLPLANWLPVDRASTGVPLPYGIDVAPDGNVWFTRLHSDEIGRLEPDSGRITMIATPFKGPRRLRSDAQGNLWISAFAESRIARYSPADGRFRLFELPVQPLGSETPYALNVDRRRGVVWVTGNQTDMLHSFEIANERWRSVPLPHRVSFTREIEVADDGSVFTSNSNFPAWHVEQREPTLMRVVPR